MKSFLGLQGLLLLLFFMRTCADHWSAFHLKCTHHWFYLRIKATIFPNIFMEPDEVFLGFGCPVSVVWPHDIYDFTYQTDSCGISRKVLHDITLIQTKLTYISKNSTLRASMPLSCVLNNQHPLTCEAESRDFTGDPPEWEVDMTTYGNEPPAPALQPNFSTPNVSQESRTSIVSSPEECSSLDQNLLFLNFSRMKKIG